MLHVELGVRPETGAQERQIVKTILGGLNFSRFAQEYMDENDIFYVLNKRFYNDWTEYCRSNSKFYCDNLLP